MFSIIDFLSNELTSALYILFSNISALIIIYLPWMLISSLTFSCFSFSTEAVRPINFLLKYHCNCTPTVLVCIIFIIVIVQFQVIKLLL